MRREEGAREEDRQTEMRPPLRLLSVLSAHSSSFKPSLAVSIAGCRWIRSSFNENNQRTPLRRVECGRRDHIPNHGKRGDDDYWLKFSTALPQMFRRGICAESDSVSSSYPMQSVRITCCGAVSDAFMEALMCFGAGSCSIEDAHLGAPQEQEIFSDGPVPWTGDKRQLWNESRITALFPAGEDVAEALAMAADSVGLTEMPQYEVVNTEEIDWVQQVQWQFKPIEVAKGLWIVPKWSTPPDPEALNVMLDPGLAFGTGEHPTTRLCLQWLQHAVRPGDQILDYGTGSGILSIAALKMGVDGAVGVDIDPMAITSAKYNASLNNIEPHMFQVLEASGDDNPLILGKGKFDIVVANILLNSLVQLATCIAAYTKPQGLVGLSGILVDQVDRVQEVYSPFLEEISVSYDNGWACVTGRKKLLL
ncbi:hypothetical protein BDL97_09G030700 [Sphagnum fallax]|nr:hypothetical protein BDL97_09G030700 [Sphagnum fallax]